MSQIEETTARPVPRPHEANRLLASLSPDDYEALRPHLRSQPLQAGAVLFDAGDLIEWVDFVQGGVVAGLIVLEHGASVEAMIIGREGLVGSLAYAGPMRAFGRAVVQIPGRSSRIEARVLRKLVEEHAGLRRRLEAYALKMQIDLAQSVACNASHRLEQRLSKCLLRCHDRVEGDTLHLTQEVLAQMLAAQRTSVAELMSAFAKADWIASIRGRVQLLDRSKLEAVTCECYATVREREQAFDRGDAGGALPPLQIR